MAKPIIVDCDPGIDDAIAIFLAIASEELDVKLVTTCAGNLSLNTVTRNALQLLNFAGQNIEVAPGADKPLLKELVVAEEVHGESGLGGIQLGEANYSVSKRSAWEAMRDVLIHSEQKVTIVAIGPLTNVALLLKAYPEVRDQIEQITIMGGACDGGNTTPVAEFNIYVDPHAAQIVFDSGLPIQMFGLDVTMKVTILKHEIEAIRNMGNRTGALVGKLLDFYSRDNRVMGMHDPCTIAYLIDSSLFTLTPCYVQVETNSQLTMGQTVVDRTSRLKNAEIAFDVDRNRMIDLLYDSLRKLN